MMFRNKKIFMLSIILIFIFLLYIPYKIGKVEYIIFGTIGFIISLIFYLFAVFEYFEVDEHKIVYVNPLRSLRKEALWSEVRRIYVYPTGVFKAVRIRYGTLEEEIVINAGVKDYKKLIKVVLNKVEGNDNTSIDRMIYEIIE
jgi:energy-coupling factor transporter transmembrane protein EcfT